MKHSFFIVALLLGATFLVTSCDKEEDACIESTWYQDADADGLGNATVSQLACEQPTGYVADNTDTDDTCMGTVDACGICDGTGETTWYEDADEDGLGNPDVSQLACDQPTGYVADNTDTNDSGSDATGGVDAALFLTDGTNFTISIVDCTLSDGTVTQCYQIVTNGMPTDHTMGPWCPDNISDGADAGGIWLENGEVHDVDGAFIQNMATFYNDDRWLMYDANGDIFKTETQDDCANAANPNVGAEYENFCVECLPSYITDLTQTYTIPMNPVLLETPYQFGGGGPGGDGGPGGGGPGGPPTGDGATISNRGIAFNGTVFDAPAPTDAILGAYTLAPFDDAGGHINLNAGYHYHAATGVSTEVAQSDGHAPMIGYAMDGHAMHAQLNADGNEPTDLDECRGHTDELRGYHYHVDAPGNNNFINCLAGAFAN